MRLFRSIRWRLVASYVLLALLTVGVLGALAYSFFVGYVRRQETEFLRSNAEAIAQQAYPLLLPVPHLSGLNELVNTTSFLGDVRVRILTAQGEVLADSGLPGRIDEFLLIQPPLAGFRIESSPDDFATFILQVPSAPHLSRSNAQEMILAFMSQLPEETRFRVVQRIPYAWGNRVRYETLPGFVSTEGVSRSSSSVTTPIGDERLSLGLVELTDGPSFSPEALRTAGRAYGFAALGAVLVAVLLGLVESRRVTAPIADLTEVTDKMASGDLTARATANGSDEIAQLAERFNHMAGKLEKNFHLLEAERDSLRQFIQDASHELRTPITALKNFNELMRTSANQDVEASADFLLESQNQIERLHWITEHLLNLSRLDASLIHIELEDIRAEEILQAVVGPFQAQVEQNQYQITIQAPNDLMLKGDRKLLELALSNLVDNALKFSPPGTRIEIGARREDPDVLLWVKDDGPGIAEQDLPRVFNRFYRGDNASAPGSGLGLALVKSIVRAHGGGADILSKLGLGTQVTLRIPGDPANPSQFDEVQQDP